MLARLPLGVVLSSLVLAGQVRGGYFPSLAEVRGDAFPDLVREALAKAQAGNWDEAVPLCVQAAKENPTHPQTWLALALSHHKAGQLREAISAYDKALELKATFPWLPAYNTACCHALLGEKDKALSWLDKALALGFRSLDHVRADADFKAFHDDAKFRELAVLIDPAKLSRVEGWRFDLKLLAREIKRRHYSPFRHVSREQFDAHVQKLHDDIPKLNDNEILVGLMKLAELAGDGHTWVRPPAPLTAAPVQLFWFTEGVFVTAAAPDHAGLVGAEVLKVGAHKTADALAALEPVISRDNPMGVKAMGPVLLTVPKVLNGLGLVPEGDKLPLTVRDAAGKEREITLTAAVQEIDKSWITARKDAKLPDSLYLKNRQASYWFEHLPESKTVYFQYNRVRDDAKEPFAKFCERLFKCIDDNDVERLVIDVRWNGGGNSFLNRPLVHGLIRCDRLKPRGRLFVITGRNTFSAAQNACTDIEMNTSALFVGEPTGSSPNAIGEMVPMTLPFSKAATSIADLYWQRSWPMDHRVWIAPHLYAPPSFELYRANRDPALEAILAYSPKK